MHYPFSDKLFDTSTSVYHLDIATDAPEGERRKDDADAVVETVEGSFCIVHAPDHLHGPYLVLKDLGTNYFDEKTYQIYSSYTTARQTLDDLDVFAALRKTIFKPGWNDSKDSKVAFTDKKPAASYEAYVMAESEIRGKIVLSGFMLTNDDRLKSSLVNWLERDVNRGTNKRKSPDSKAK